MDVEVREARPDDYAMWSVLWQGYLDFAGSTLSEAVTRATGRAFIPESTLLCRVAVMDGQLVGFALCVMHEGTGSRSPSVIWKTFMWMHNCAVAVRGER